MIKRLGLTVLLGLCLSACETTQTGFHWGNYESNLYEYFHTPAHRDEVLQDQLAFIARIEARQQLPAPGIYADTGTMLYLKGDKPRALEFYRKELQAWPESEYLMTTLITNLEQSLNENN